MSIASWKRPESRRFSSLRPDLTETCEGISRQYVTTRFAMRPHMGSRSDAPASPRLQASKKRRQNAQAFAQNLCRSNQRLLSPHSSPRVILRGEETEEPEDGRQ